MTFCAVFGTNTSLAAQGALAHRLQRRSACKIQNGRQGGPKWPMGSGKVSTVFGRSKQLLLNKFFDPSTPSMRKGRDGGKRGKKTGGKNKENTDENSGHYIIASSRPPERRPLEHRTLVPKMLTLKMGSL